MPRYQRTGEVELAIAPHLEQVAFHLAAAMSILGSSREWEVETIEHVAERFNTIAEIIGAPEVSDQSEEALLHWRLVADEHGIEHDGEENPECECSDYFDTAEAYDDEGNLVPDGKHEHRDGGLPGTDDVPGCAVAGCLCQHVADWGRWL